MVVKEMKVFFAGLGNMAERLQDRRYADFESVFLFVTLSLPQVDMMMDCRELTK